MTTESATAPKPSSIRTVQRKKRSSLPTTLEGFLRWQQPENGYKYEWNNGIVEKTKAMNQQQSKLFFLLSRLFLQTAAFKNGGGLISETDMDTTEVQLRRPDIAFYSGEQISRMKPGENQVAPWLAEVISPTDNADKINEKLEEYFRAGVQVVWHIFPTSKKVDVFTSPDDVTICRGKTVCSGAPALPDFQIPAEALFA